MRYDPAQSPDPADWLEADEGDRLGEVIDYHERTKARGNPHIHATIHLILENQLAEGLPGAVGAMERLQQEGLDRHEAIHAIGMILMEALGEADRRGSFDAAQYEARLDAFTVDEWRHLVDDE